jgi:hypothetical protein
MTVDSDIYPAEDLLRAYLERFTAGDLDGIVALFDTQSLVEIPLLQDRVFGSAAVRSTFAGILTSVTNVRVKLNSVIGSDVLAFGEGGFAADGANGFPDLDFGFGIVVEVRDGRISRLSEYFDTDSILPIGS